MIQITMNWLPMNVPYPECLKNLIKSSMYTENNIEDRTPPCLTPQNIEKFTPRKLFHITDAVSLLCQLRSNCTNATDTFRSKSLKKQSVVQHLIKRFRGVQKCTINFATFANEVFGCFLKGKQSSRATVLFF